MHSPKPAEFCTGRRHEGLHKRELRAAEEFCRGHGAHLTSSRKDVLHVLLTAHSAVGAYDVLDRLIELRVEKQVRAKMSGEPVQSKSHPTPSQVYRSLRFLVDNGLAHYISSFKAFAARDIKDLDPPRRKAYADRGYYGYRSPPKSADSGSDGTVLLVCESCREVREIPSKVLRESVESVVRDAGFELNWAAGQLPEIVGRCAGCARSES